MARAKQFEVLVEGNGEPGNVTVSHDGEYYCIYGICDLPVVLPSDEQMLSDIATVIDAIVNEDVDSEALS